MSGMRCWDDVLTFCACAGLMALPRSPLHAGNELEEKEADDVIDHSSLPPG